MDRPLITRSGKSAGETSMRDCFSVLKLLDAICNRDPEALANHPRHSANRTGRSAISRTLAHRSRISAAVNAARMRGAKRAGNRTAEPQSFHSGPHWSAARGSCTERCA
jgi:hypothetical protein